MSHLCSMCCAVKDSLRKNDQVAPVADSLTNVPEECQQSVLLTATCLGHAECVSALLSTGKVDVNQVSSFSKRTPLIWAAAKGLNNVIEKLLENGAKLDLKDTLNYRPAVWYAANEGHASSLKMLVDAGCKLYPGFTRTALCAAVMKLNVDCIRILIDAGDQPGISSNSKPHFFKFTAKLDSLPEDIVKDLLDLMLEELKEDPVDVFMYPFTRNSRTLVEKVMSWDKDVVCLSQYIQAGILAIDCGRDQTLDCYLTILDKRESRLKEEILNRVHGEDLWTSLQRACECDGNPSRIMEVLLEHGANPDLLLDPDEAFFIVKKRPPLYMVLRTLSFRKDGLYNLATLIRYGCVVEQKMAMNFLGTKKSVKVTPLEYALYGRNLYAVRVLMMAGAQNCRDMSNMRPRKDLVDESLACSLKERRAFLQEELRTPRSLHVLCRAVISRCFCGNPRAKIDSLPLPVPEKDFLKYTDIEQVARDFENKMAEIPDLSYEGEASDREGEWWHSDEEVESYNEDEEEEEIYNHNETEDDDEESYNETEDDEDGESYNEEDDADDDDEEEEEEDSDEHLIAWHMLPKAQTTTYLPF